MKTLCSALILILTLIVCTAYAVAEEQTIKVLIQTSPEKPLPAESTETVGRLRGEILIDDTFYKGDFEVRRDNQGLYFITTLPLERYTAGVIAAETGDDWAMEALKAQAVISRTYALYQKVHAGSEDYHITSSILQEVKIII
jgi:peptidoglycan hydrolase-like amidase